MKNVYDNKAAGGLYEKVCKIGGRFCGFGRGPGPCGLPQFRRFRLLSELFDRGGHNRYDKDEHRHNDNYDDSNDRDNGFRIDLFRQNLLFVNTQLFRRRGALHI